MTDLPLPAFGYLCLLGLLACGKQASAPSEPRDPGAASEPSVLVEAPTAVASSTPSAVSSSNELVKLESSAVMVAVPAGRFMMGSDRAPDEQPRHEVELAAFSIDRVEVTVADYRACVVAGRCALPDTEGSCNWSDAARADHPINCVSWQDASAYCESVGKRLPTEEEWEYAARGGDNRTYPWGEKRPTKELTCWSRWALNEGTCPVGSRPLSRSPFGVDDMAGNVWEWTASEHTEGYGREASGKGRVCRGGGWDNGVPIIMRAAVRLAEAPTTRAKDIGFRCAK